MLAQDFSFVHRFSLDLANAKFLKLLFGTRLASELERSDPTKNIGNHMETLVLTYLFSNPLLI